MITISLHCDVIGIQNYRTIDFIAVFNSVITYEGTHDIHLLITWHDVTGIGAFK